MKSKIRDLQILLQKEDLFGAKNFCEDFLRNQNIDDAKFYNLYALILFKLNNYEHAIDNWKKSLEIDPKIIESYNGLANSFLKLEKFDEAIKNFDQIIKIKPSIGEIYHGKAFALMNLCKFDDAINNFKIASKKNPTNPDIYNMLGSTFFRQKKWEEACENFVKALELKHNHSLALKNLINLLTFYQPKKNLDNSIIFQRPSIYSRPVAILEAGRLCLVKKCKNNWCKINSGNYSGWVEKQNLKGRL